MSDRIAGVDALARVVAAMDAVEDGDLDLAWQVLRDLELDIEACAEWKAAA